MNNFYELTDDDRQIIEAVLRGEPEADVAVRLKLTRGRVRHRLFRAISVLREAGQDVTGIEAAFAARPRS